MPSVGDEGDSRDGECCCDDHGHRSGVTSLRQEASSDDAARFAWLTGSLGRGRRYGRIRFYRRLLRSRRLGKRIAELNRLDSLPILGITEGCFELALFVINNGDRVEILTSQNSKGPSRDWLNVVKSTQAKNKINQWFKNELKDDNIIKGRELLLSYCKAKSINQVDIMRPEYMESIMKKFGFRDWESVLAALGHGGLKEGQIINKMKEMYDRDHPKELSDEEVIKAVEESAAAKQMLPRSKTENGIVVKGIHDVAVRFSKCCSPVPGDEIIGFVTRGRGISIHRTDCVNIINLPEIERSRLIDAEWQDESIDGKGRYFAEITIYANNRNGLLADVSRALTEKNIDIQSMNTRTSKQGVATMNVAFEISSKEELNRVIDKLHNIESVLSIERTTG